MSLVIAAATALSYPFYLDSHRVLSDIPFAAVFWWLLYVAAGWRRRPWLGLVLMGVLSVVGVVVRAPGVLLFGPVRWGCCWSGSLGRLVWGGCGRRGRC